MYKILLGCAVLSATVFGLVRPSLANEVLVAQSDVGRVVYVNAEQSNLVTVKGVVIRISGGDVQPVVTGHQTMMRRDNATSGELVHIRVGEDGREQVFVMSQAAQAAAGIKAGATVDLTFVGQELVAVAGPSGNYQIAQVKTLESRSVALSTGSSESSMTTTTESTTSVPVEQPAAQPEVEPITGLW